MNQANNSLDSWCCKLMQFFLLMFVLRMRMLAMKWRSQWGHRRKRERLGRRKRGILTAPRDGHNSVYYNHWSEKQSKTTVLVSVQIGAGRICRQAPLLVSWAKRRLIKDTVYLFWIISSVPALELWGTRELGQEWFCRGNTLDWRGKAW